MKRHSLFSLVILLLFFLIGSASADDVVLENNTGVKWILPETADGYALGSFYLNEKPVETPLTAGMMKFVRISDESDRWFFASDCRQFSSAKAVFSGMGDLAGATLRFEVTAEIPSDIHAVRITYDYSVDGDVPDYRACLLFHSDFDFQWKCHIYPWAEDAKFVKRDPLTDMGIPSLLLYREDRSLGMLWGIDMNFDYLNPTTWTGDFGLYFIDGVLPAQWRVGGDKLKESIDYHCPMQLVLTDERDPDEMIIDVVDSWIQVNGYEVEQLFVRNNDQALELFIDGRKNNTEAWHPGKGYSLHGARPTFIYMGVQGMAPYFDYMLYELTGDEMWRRRAFEQMDFVIQGQNRDPLDHNYGAVHTSYTLTEEYAQRYGPSPQGWDSDDRWNIGYKPDIVALLARYMLKTWKLVKDHEGLDRRDWYETAVLAINWITRQQNNDGGLPQKVQIAPLEERWFDENHNLVIQPVKSRSATSGRALPAFWYFYRFTGEPRYKEFMEKLEQYHLTDVQHKYYFTSHHPDLPPYEFEEASIWGVCEYWLNRYDETGEEKYLRHAVANGYLALTWWCPKQLSWVDNPTQGGSAEQLHYLQYSVYNYQCRKVESLKRLYDRTGNPLFGELFERMLQNIYFTQKTEGIDKGGTYERIADPWLARDWEKEGKFNSFGAYYTNEQALDCFVQTFELYRTGEKLYIGAGLTNKVYPDGRCYYNMDIGKQQKTELTVLPSRGSLMVTIQRWNRQERVWTAGEASDSSISATITVGGLEPNSWHSLSIEGRTAGEYQANPDGFFSFMHSGDLNAAVTFEVKAVSH